MMFFGCKAKNDLIEIQFTVQVKHNSPPEFSKEIDTIITTQIGKITKFKFPKIIDKDNNGVSELIL